MIWEAVSAVPRANLGALCCAYFEIKAPASTMETAKVRFQTRAGRGPIRTTCPNLRRPVCSSICLGGLLHRDRRTVFPAGPCLFLAVTQTDRFLAAPGSALPPGTLALGQAGLPFRAAVGEVPVRRTAAREYRRGQEQRDSDCLHDAPLPHCHQAPRAERLRSAGCLNRTPSGDATQGWLPPAVPGNPVGGKKIRRTWLESNLP